MDFIEQLLKSSGFTAILVVVDRLMKQAIFIPTHDTITSANLTKLFMLHIYAFKLRTIKLLLLAQVCDRWDGDHETTAVAARSKL